ncbi:MAG: hypothetical protein V4555_20885, partial [Acidobacteriota bacterium]
MNVSRLNAAAQMVFRTSTIFAAGLLCTSVAIAQNSTVPAKANAVAPDHRSAPSVEPQAEKPSRPGGEGVKVHGHWTVDIKNPDGTL